MAGATRTLVNHTSPPISLIIQQRVFSLPPLLNGPKDLFSSSGLLFLHGEKLNAALGVEEEEGERKRVCKQTSEKELGQHLLRVRVAVVGHHRGDISHEQEMKSWNNFPSCLKNKKVIRS